MDIAFLLKKSIFLFRKKTIFAKKEALNKKIDISSKLIYYL